MPTSPVYFPQIVDGGGYTTQFILFEPVPNTVSAGTLQLLKQNGENLMLTLSNN
jgi:hypothetical protein